MTPSQQSFLRLQQIVAELRVKCPWDRKQTKESLRHLTLEESYELADAILQGDYQEMKVELGDLMLHILFYASLAEDSGQFDIHDVLTAQIDKLIRRHPHVYGDLQGASEAEIHANWEQIKARERAGQGKQRASVLDGVPDSMPALIKAQRMQEKASQVGFDWENKEQVWEKFQEEIAEFKAAETPEQQADEMGDLLFTLVNYCRFLDINAEDALARSNLKFKRRFEAVEENVYRQGKEMKQMKLSELEAIWQQAKLRTDSEMK